MDPTLITRAGSSALAAFSSCGSNARVRWKTAFTFRARSLSHAASGYSASGAPQFAPALLTSTCSAGSRDASSPARRLHSPSVARFAGSARQVPSAESSAATSSQTSALREAM